MDILVNPLYELKEFNDLKKDLENNKIPLQITGCIDSQKCHIINALARDYNTRIIITHDNLRAKEIYEDYKLYDKNVCLYPSKDVIFFSADIRGNIIVQQRMNVLKRIIEKQSLTIIMVIDGTMDYILPFKYIIENIITISEGEIIDLENLKENLIKIGYERQIQVEAAGEFAIRGNIIDIYPLTETTPYRIELWDDEIDMIKSFDVESQRSIERVQSLKIYPASEIILNVETKTKGIKKILDDKKDYVKKLKDEKKYEAADRIEMIIDEFCENIMNISASISVDNYINYFYDNTACFLDYFNNEDTIIFLDEFNRIIDKATTVETEFRESMIGRLENGYILPNQSNLIYSYETILAKLNYKNILFISTLDFKIQHFDIKNKYNFTVQSINSYNSDMNALIDDLKNYTKNNYRIILASGSSSRAKRIKDDLIEIGLNAFCEDETENDLIDGNIIILNGGIRKGFEYPFIKLVFLSESNIFGKEKKRRKRKKNYEGSKIKSFNDLNINDYVVHEEHGIGIYKGIEKIEVEGITKDYIKIEYAGDGILYVLATGLDVIQKYASSEARKPKLNKLNSSDWKKTKTKAKQSAEGIAQELVELYAKRQLENGYCYSPDTFWQKEFEEMFPYDETDDQLMAIKATKEDMESNKIMDRLICGDVGYGKTEIAIRAAFKAVMEGKQVVILVPTTILAQQHYNTFIQRMKEFPVNIDMLSRFKTKSQQKKTIDKLKDGSLDIIIGTHRILSKDIEFKDLGLLVVDEEQRFGVRHKEKIKQLKGNVDVLTLSATPIPRTLHMSLIGIRDMSVLEEPPIDRLPIQTYVLEYNEEIIREAINRELARDGQIYYVYNRVTNIDEVALKIAKIVPDAVVSFAHGQMNERELEKIMLDFINGDIDVLVATTIIETGIDISNVNTMIIDNADKLGLSQLYQLRGRVGRSNRTSYAFLLYKRDKILKEEANKRLQAIKEFTDLGSGFKIAKKDLEFRGAGNMLGQKQHGHMEAVGYDLYCKMLNEAVRSLKGEMTIGETFTTEIDLNISAFIPATYIKSEYQKLDMYKRIAHIENEEEFLDIQDELIDRFGQLPDTVNNLLNIALIKAYGHQAFIKKISNNEKDTKFFIFEGAKFNIEKLKVFIEENKDIITFKNKPQEQFIYNINNKSIVKTDVNTWFENVKYILKSLKELI